VKLSQKKEKKIALRRMPFHIYIYSHMHACVPMRLFKNRSEYNLYYFEETLINHIYYT
jgi:hypothetical protein